MEELIEIYNDRIIETIYKYLPDDKKVWNIVGFINKQGDIYQFGSDSKIVGRVFEVLVFEALHKTAEELGFVLCEATKQNVYPDFYFIKRDGKRIAIDIKTTYRRGDSKFFYTGGSFTSFLRNNTKNIEGKNSDYVKHYILGILYTREEKYTKEIINFIDIDKAVPAYRDIDVFVQEKFRICGDKKGSGNTDNIGTIKANTLEPFIYGAGPFAMLGEEIYHEYWKNHPKYKDSKKVKDSLYDDLDGYISWVAKADKERAKLLRNQYEKYKLWYKEKFEKG